MHHPSFFHVALAAILFCIICGAVVMVIAIWTARPDPCEKQEEFDEADIFSVKPKMKVK